MFSAEPMSIGNNYQHYLGSWSPIDWKLLKETLEDEWNIVVLMGYRRYFDWLPSSYQQINRYSPAKPKLKFWPSREDEPGKGKEIPYLFPGLWKQKSKLGGLAYHDTDQLVQMIDNILPTVLFNMEDKRPLDLDNSTDIILPPNEKVSLLSRFFCTTLQEAGVTTDFTCHQSLEADKNLTSEVIANPSKTVFYDSLTVAAYRKKMIKSTLVRHKVVMRVQAFHRDVLNQTDRDFPVLCPSNTELEEFLALSLSKEARLLPTFYNTTDGHDSHVAAFWENVKKNKYCWIDTEKTLQQEEWINFFQQFSANA